MESEEISYPVVVIKREKFNKVFEYSEEVPVVLVVDKHSIVRILIKMFVGEVSDQAVVLQADTTEQMVTLLNEHVVDLLILDPDLTDGYGLRLLSKIRESQPDMLVLVFSLLDKAIYAKHYAAAGADGFLSKNSTESEVRAAIISMMRRRTGIVDATQLSPMPQVVVNTNVNENPLERLSASELEMARLLGMGYSTDRIACWLDVSESTVTIMTSRLFKKLQINRMIDFLKIICKYLL